MFDAKVLKVLISAPGDTASAVAAAIDALHGLNGSRAERDGVMILPRHWQSDAIPLLHTDGGQGVINQQLVDSADIVVALFDSRLGQATPNAVSGTAEEIERALAAGKPIHVYFSDEPIPRDADLEQLAGLQKFRKELEGKGLLGIYANSNDLAYRVRAAIEHDIDQMDLGGQTVPSRPPTTEHAMPRLRYDEGRKRVILENRSPTVRADQLTLEVLEQGPFRLFYDGEPFDLPPLAEASFPITLAWGANKIVVRIRWLENGEMQEETITLTF